MKKILFIGFILVFLMASFSYAEDQCRILGELAETIMTKRQNGVDLIEMLDTVERQNSPSEVKNVTKKLIISAYDRGEYSSEEYKQRAIRRFKTKVMVECYKSE
jgi:hypothetical protein